MKKINLQLIITGIRAKVDGSLGLTVSTPEMSVEDKVEVMKLQRQVVDALLTPMDEPNVEDYKIDKEIEQKSPGQRLRAVIYVWWEQSGTSEEWEPFYKRQMERIIDRVKDKLDA